jgi:hypothetical protein
MATLTKNDELYLDLDRFTKLEKENPKLLGEIIQKRLDIGLANIYQQRKEAGLSVTYRDNDYPGCLIREDADGSRFIIDLDPKNNYQEFVVRPIPPRQKAA